MLKFSILLPTISVYSRNKINKTNRVPQKAHMYSRVLLIWNSTHFAKVRVSGNCDSVFAIPRYSGNCGFAKTRRLTFAICGETLEIATLPIAFRDFQKVWLLRSKLWLLRNGLRKNQIFWSQFPEPLGITISHTCPDFANYCSGYKSVVVNNWSINYYHKIRHRFVMLYANNSNSSSVSHRGSRMSISVILILWVIKICFPRN